MATRSTAASEGEIVLVGPPNAGKSSLFNALVSRYRADSEQSWAPPGTALVSPHPGTTRDYLTATLDLGGIRCELIDTAGVDVRPTTPIEIAAQSLAAERRSGAAIRIWCTDTTTAQGAPPDCDLTVLTKADLVPHQLASPTKGAPAPFDRDTVVTSSRTGEGLGELCDMLRTLFLRDAAAGREPIVAATADRCRESVRLAAAALRRSIETVLSGSGEELVAAEIRDALAEIGKVVGAVYTDELLDRIFKTFCIGK
jgi:tRNA modification GTPase